jgi:hypothetical protein
VNGLVDGAHAVAAGQGRDVEFKHGGSMVCEGRACTLARHGVQRQVKPIQYGLDSEGGPGRFG